MNLHITKHRTGHLKLIEHRKRYFSGDFPTLSMYAAVASEDILSYWQRTT